MSAPAVIDVLDFARAAEQLAGSLPVASLKRLEDVLYDTQGDLQYEVRGGRDELMRPQLQVRVSGRLQLECQRCLGLLDHPLNVLNTLLVAPRGSDVNEGIDDPDVPEMIEENPALDVASLIEDEVLLALPLAPRHPAGECGSELQTHEPADDARSAFAKLAALKRPRTKP